MGTLSEIERLRAEVQRLRHDLLVLANAGLDVASTVKRHDVNLFATPAGQAADNLAHRAKDVIRRHRLSHGVQDWE